jgi:putative ABC transport system substrate-binding protein
MSAFDPKRTLALTPPFGSPVLGATIAIMGTRADVKRRKFLGVLAGFAVGWPHHLRAQQRATVGFLSSRSPIESESALTAFRQGLKDNGYAEGENIIIEYRWADGQYERLPNLAKELVSRQVALIAATGDAVSALAAKAATTLIPIVFVIGGDPVRFGLVTSINRPGGNLTGVSLVSSGLGAKRLGLLNELIPNAAVLGLLLNPENPNAEPEQQDVWQAAVTLGKHIVIVNARTESDFAPAFATLAEEKAGGLIVATDPFLLTRRNEIVALAARHAIPTMYQFRQFAISGGLMSYGTDIIGAYRKAGEYSGLILKGDKLVQDLPVFQQTKLELVINLKTAKVLGLNIPTNLLVFADEVIE